MKVSGIDEEKCIKCLECVKDCPIHLFHKPPTELGEKRRVIFEDPYDSCIGCGHCISLCPTDAVEYEADEEMDTFEGVEDPSQLIDYKNLLHILRARRSVRRYKDKEVPQEEIKKILDAMKYAPSASNAQEREYIVLTNEDEIELVRKATLKMLKMLKKLIKYAKYIKFLLPSGIKEQVEDESRKASLDALLEQVEAGKDPIFYNAPVVIITHAPGGTSPIMTGGDAGIALTYGMLAADSIGLGTCWIGFAQEALNRFKKNKKKLDIPKKMNVNGVFIVGYPAVNYKRVPPREPLKIKWK